MPTTWKVELSLSMAATNRSRNEIAATVAAIKGSSKWFRVQQRHCNFHRWRQNRIAANPKTQNNLANPDSDNLYSASQKQFKKFLTRFKALGRLSCTFLGSHIGYGILVTRNWQSTSWSRKSGE